MTKSDSLSRRWHRIRNELTLRDLLLDVTGKMLMGLGLGVLFAASLKPYAWCLIGTGLLASLLVKAKYWKKFWA